VHEREKRVAGIAAGNPNRLSDSAEVDNNRGFEETEGRTENGERQDFTTACQVCY